MTIDGTEGAVQSSEPEGSTIGCSVCGQGLASRGTCPNRWCRRSDRGFSVVFAVGVHDGALRHAVLRYKYQRELWWAGVFARLFADYLLSHATWFEEFDLLVPAPAYAGPAARRDWDPVGEIAARLRPLVEPLWDTAIGAVAKRAETPAMQGRGWAARQAIASGALRRALVIPAPPVVAGARVLVLDDVLTEGSTLREIARALRRAGARSGGAGAGPTRMAADAARPDPRAVRYAGCPTSW